MKRTAAHNLLSDRLASLSELIRLRIGRLLAAQELSVGELSRVLQAPQSTVSRHLRVLSEAGWLARRADGTATFYRLSDAELEPGMRGLWVAVAGQFDQDDATLAEDDRRVQSVLAERRTDSLAFFGRVAGQWDAVRQEMFGDSFAAQALLAFLPAEWEVADLGCGTGFASEALAQVVKRVVCVDQSGPMLDAARKRLRDFDNVEFMQGPIEALPLEDACVDAALCMLVLHYLDSPQDGICEMRRVLRPGGRALIVDMFAHGRGEYRNTMGHKHLGFAPEQIEAFCREAGFDQVRIIPLPSNPEAKGPGLFAAVAE